MPKVKLPYEVKNNLDEYITREAGRRMLSSGAKVFRQNIMEDIASYAEVGLDNIKRINRNVAQPSLAVALKIAEYFDVKVEDIFKIS